VGVRPEKGTMSNGWKSHLERIKQTTGSEFWVCTGNSVC